MNLRNRLLITIAALLLLVLPFIRNSSLAQSNDFLYFPETNHSIKGEFLEKFNSVSDPVKIFGYPITEEIVAPDTSPFVGKRIQYFQRAIFEYKSGIAPSQRVQLVPLGSWLISPTNFIPYEHVQANHPACETFPGSPHPVCYAFLQFFTDNGGISVFGLPITDLVLEHDRFIQYFEFARFEWRPRMPSGHRVHLTNLGDIYFNANEDPSLKDVVPIGQSIQSMDVRAFTQQSILSSSGRQTFFVSVVDQSKKPLAGAEVNLRIFLAGGDAVLLPLGVTNEKGFIEGSFDHNDEPVGRVYVLVEVNYQNDYTKVVRLSYRIW